MKISDIKTHLLDEFQGHQQNSKAALIALDSIQAGLDELSKMGFRYEIQPFEPGPMFREYPKMLYRGEATVEVDDERQEDELRKAGWDLHHTLRKEISTSEPERGDLNSLNPEDQSHALSLSETAQTDGSSEAQSILREEGGHSD